MSNQLEGLQLIDEISLSLLEKGVGRFDVLQAVLPTVLQADIDSDETRERFPKLLRIAQLQIEHLLKSQHQLIKSLEEKDKELQAKKIENRILKKSIENDTSRQFYKCSCCEKMFLNEEFLSDHLQRKHANQITSVRPIRK